MGKVITVTKTFLKEHPRAGEQTHFVQKILHGMIQGNGFTPITQIADPAKYTTIRGGERYKTGDWISLRTWKGVPRRSTQDIIAPDLQVKVWSIDISVGGYIDRPIIRICIGQHLYVELPFDFVQMEENQKLITLANNDGLTVPDFISWFTKTKEFRKTKFFGGQIICWNHKIQY